MSLEDQRRIEETRVFAVAAKNPRFRFQFGRHSMHPDFFFQEFSLYDPRDGKLRSELKFLMC